MNTSVEQIVRQIIEELSEGVSDLVLLVVVLAEQNATMPGHLPQTATVVNQTAEKLAAIARQLAGSDYKPYPKIANEINESADAVEDATKVMSGAVNTLQRSADRKKGWDSIVEACRVMSGKTIRLLQIVYGAPMERIRINADNTIAAIDKLNPRPRVDNTGGQQNFLDQIKPITDGALRQNKYLNDRADNAPTDQARRELRQEADAAKQKAQDLVDAVNRGFKDPRDADFTKPLQDLRDTIGRGKDVFNKHAPAAPAYPSEKFDPTAGPPAYRGQLGKYPMPPRNPSGSPGRDNDSPFPNKQQLSQAVARIPPPMNKALDRPEDRERLPYDKLRDNLNNIRDGIKQNNPKKVAENIKQAVPAAQQLAQQYRKSPDFEKHEAADDIERLINPFVETGRDAVKNLGDDNVVRPFRDNVKKMQRAADRGNPKSYQRPPTKADFDKVKEGMARARDAAKRRDRPAFQKALDDIKEPMNRIRFNIQKGKGLPDLPNPDGPSDELKRLWEKFRNAINKTDWDEMDNNLRDLDKLWDRYDKDSTNRAPYNAAYQLGDAIDRAQGAVDSGNHQRYQPASQNVRDRIRAFEDEVNRSNDPRVKQAGQRAIQQLRPQIDDYLDKAQDAINNPRDPLRAAAAANQAARIKQTLADFHQQSNPQDSVLINDKYGQDVKKALADLADAKASGNPAEVKRALENLKNAMDKYNNHARNVANAQKEPGKRGYLTNKVGDLERSRNDLENMPQPFNDHIERYTDHIAPLIDDFSDTLHNNDSHNAIKASAKAHNLAGYLDSIDDEQFHHGGGYGMAGDICDLSGGLIGDPQGVADDLDTSNNDAVHETARHAKDLNNLVRGGPGGGGRNQSGGGSAGFPSGGSGGISAPKLPLGQARSFEDIAQAVAYNIQEQCKAYESENGKLIAKELANLAAAARSGDKQKMLTSAKAAAGHLLNYSKEITDIANKIHAKNTYEHDTQSHMIKCAASIRNYATHLKILASVKAASIEQSRDTDASLSTICTELGDMMSQTLNSMGVTHSVILKSPKH